MLPNDFAPVPAQRNPMILSKSDNRGGGCMSTTSEEDFQPLPQYSQSIRANESWWAITTKRTDPDGSVTQFLKIGFKPKS
jgi:hypothetical protein